MTQQVPPHSLMPGSYYVNKHVTINGDLTVAGNTNFNGGVTAASIHSSILSTNVTRLDAESLSEIHSTPFAVLTPQSGTLNCIDHILARYIAGQTPLAGGNLFFQYPDGTQIARAIPESLLSGESIDVVRMYNPTVPIQNADIQLVATGPISGDGALMIVIWYSTIAFTEASVSSNALPSSYDAAGQLLSFGADAFAYDPSGNITSIFQ